MDAGANASALPMLTVASLVGFGAVVASLPGFAAVREWVLSIGGGPLVSLAVATNVLAALTGSASGGMARVGCTWQYLYAPCFGTRHRSCAHAPRGCDRVRNARSLPHNGGVVTLLAVCGTTHRESYLDIVMVAAVSAIIALVVIIALGALFGSF
jgi:H+/gluconate symporter-like permease